MVALPSPSTLLNVTNFLKLNIPLSRLSTRAILGECKKFDEVVKAAEVAAKDEMKEVNNLISLGREKSHITSFPRPPCSPSSVRVYKAHTPTLIINQVTTESKLQARLIKGKECDIVGSCSTDQRATHCLTRFFSLIRRQ